MVIQLGTLKITIQKEIDNDNRLEEKRRLEQYMQQRELETLRLYHSLPRLF
jgi:hypothetical protein